MFDRRGSVTSNRHSITFNRLNSTTSQKSRGASFLRDKNKWWGGNAPSESSKKNKIRVGAGIGSIKEKNQYQH